MNMKRSNEFINHLKERNPEVNIDLAIKAFDSQVKKVQVGSSAPKELPVGCDLNLAIFIKSMQEYERLVEESRRETEDDDVVIPGYNH